MYIKKTLLCSILLLFTFTVQGEGFGGHRFDNLYEGDSCVDVASEQKGICTPLSSCPEVSNNFDYFLKNGTTCWEGKGTSVVCCLKPVSQYVPPDKRTISQKKCFEYTNVLSADKLDIPPRRLKRQFGANVAGGFGAGTSEENPGLLPHQVAHMAALGWLTASEDLVFKCSGTIISELFILTSAHCTTSNDPDVMFPEPNSVRVGAYNLPPNLVPDSEPVFVRIASLIPHPEYKAPLKYHDISLVRLKTPLIFNAFVRPACLWPVADNGDKEFGLSMRWTVNKISDLVKPKWKLLESSVNLFGSLFCSAVSTIDVKDKNWPQGISSEQLCAGDALREGELCKGDTGGPIVVNGPFDIFIYYVVGVTSFTELCHDGKDIAFYERVYPYTRWIESVVWAPQ